jgi:cholesterol transport system auxiliary component
MKAQLLVIALAASGSLAGCSMFSRSSPVEVRYFSPEPAPVAGARPTPTKTPLQPTGATEPSTRERRSVRLGRIAPSEHLREEIVRRESPYEIDVYENRLWTEPPDVYVRRALERALFERRGLEEALRGATLTLHVEVTGFEETVHPHHAGRVQLRYRLENAQRVVDSGVITVESPAAGTEFSAVVAAIGAALDEASTRVAEAVVRELAAQPST